MPTERSVYRERCDVTWPGAHSEDNCQRVIPSGVHRCTMNADEEHACICLCGLDGPR